MTADNGTIDLRTGKLLPDHIERVDNVVRELGTAVWRNGFLESGLAAELPAAGEVDRAVDDDAMQPRAERSAPVEALEAAQRGEKGFLRDVLGGRCVVDDEKRGSKCLRPVQPKESLERRG